MEEFTPWSTNENNNGINPLTGREEIGFPKDPQEGLAKKYLQLVQRAQEINDKSQELIRKIDGLREELHVSPEMNQKLINAYKEELSANIEKEKPFSAQMSELFEKMDEQTKEKYLTKIETKN